MAAIAMYNIKIKSSIHDYEVQFITDTAKVLNDILKPYDYIIIDNKIIQLYNDDLRNILKFVKHIGIDASENQKSYQGIIPIIQELIDNGFKKNHRLVAIGGGITQDVTAFISSILYRGVSWLFFPTTLLSQGDSCIGSKTSINFAQYKNQVGGFYPPQNIFINTDFLNTLSDIDIKSGLGEMFHYFPIAGEEDFKRFKQAYPIALQNKEVLKDLIARSLEIKRKYIEIDEFDKKERQVLNFGHSFGHAIESVTNYRVPHGIAVSYGVDIANFISVKLGFIPEEIRIEMREVLEKIWEGTYINDISIDKFKLALSKDKKNVGKELRLILNKGYGRMFKAEIQMNDEFSKWIEEYFNNEINHR